MSEIMLLWSEEPGSPIDLEPDEPVLIGGGPTCQVHVRGAPLIAAEVVVRPGHPRRRTWLPDRPDQPRVVLTPYWTDRAGTPRRDDDAASEVEAGSTIDVGGTSFTILKASEIQLGGHLLVRWFQRLVRALFPGTSGGRGSRLKRERALLPGARRRDLIRYLGLVVDRREARLARDTLDLGRLAALFAVPFALVLTAGIWASAETGDLDPMSASSLLVTIGLLTTLVTSSFFFAGVGPPVLAITLSASLLIGVGEPVVTYLIPLLLPLIWYWGGVLDLAWFPVPSEDRFWDAGLLAVGSGLYLLYPVFAWGDLAPQGPGALLLLISAAIEAPREPRRRKRVRPPHPSLTERILPGKRWPSKRRTRASGPTRGRGRSGIFHRRPGVRTGNVSCAPVFYNVESSPCPSAMALRFHAARTGPPFRASPLSCCACSWPPRIGTRCSRRWPRNMPRGWSRRGAGVPASGCGGRRWDRFRPWWGRGGGVAGAASGPERTG